MMVKLKPLAAVAAFITSFLTLTVAAPTAEPRQASTSSYWLANINRQGSVAYGSDPSYKVYRNVKDYGATGDGNTDDFEAINKTMWDGNRCGWGCDSSTTTPALVYFPPGVYRVSQPIVMPYYTQMVGDAVSMPTIKALPNFLGIALVDSDPYIPGVSNPDGSGINFYTNQNNFFRQVRNFYLDVTALPESVGACIHWQVAQATSLQNIVFNMLPKSNTNQQKGIFMDNGSGGFMSDLVFNGGGIAAFLGNQQFTSRNWTFNAPSTAIFQNWGWLWTYKSLQINNADIGIDMSTLTNGVNQTVGSIMILDSSITNSAVGIKTSYNATSSPPTGGSLAMQNVDFTGTNVAVAGADGVSTVLPGSHKVVYYAQGDAIVPQSGSTQRLAKRLPPAPPASTPDSCDDVNTTSTATSAPSGAPSTSVQYSNSSSSPNTTPASNGTCTVAAVPVHSTKVQGELSAPTMPSALLKADGTVFERSKPQYEGVPASSFVSVKSAGAKGDGVTDDSAAIQSVFDKYQQGTVVYFDHGAYYVTTTIRVPKNCIITGEIWPLIMAGGSFFQDQTSPQPVFQIGSTGDTGNVEITDLIFETRGIAPGAVMIEWNVAGESQGTAGMWDAHVRIGGTAGTQLQKDTCSNETMAGQFNPSCVGSFLMMHVTQTASAYLENVWLWVADHELDITTHGNINIFNGRGMLVESQGPVWMYGTSVEHSQLYNYQLSNAKDIFMGAIQTETAYMQAKPNALDGGFTPNPAYSDPTFADCTTDSCKKTWGLRVVDSSDVRVWGAGLYSFFEAYDQTCLENETCQTNMVDIQCSSDVELIGYTSIGTTSMINVDGQSVAAGLQHINNFGDTLIQAQF